MTLPQIPHDGPPADLNPGSPPQAQAAPSVVSWSQLDLLDDLNDAVILIDADWRIQRWNRAADELYGWSAAEVLGQPLRTIIPTLRYLDGSSTAESFAVLQQQSFWKGEVLHRHRDGHELYIEASTRIVRDAQGQLLGVISVNRDITARRQAEQTIRQHYLAEQQARQTADRLSAASLALSGTLDLPRVLAALLEHLLALVPADRASVLLLEPDGRLHLRALRSGDQLWQPAGARRDNATQLAPGLSAALLTEHRSVLIDDTLARPGWAVAPAGPPLRSWLGLPLLSGGELIGLCVAEHAEAEHFTAEHLRQAELLATPATAAIQNALLFAEVRAGRSRLSQLSQRLVEVQERERGHLARELHDEIGQMLTGLNLVLEVGTRIPPELLKERLAEAQGLVNELTARVRELSLDLRPAMLDDLGLLAALEWHVKRFTSQTRIAVHCKHVGLERRLPPPLEVAAYRIVQEALTNVARHARVEQVTVRLWTTSELLGVQIQDQGAGFDPAAALARGMSSGLIGMHERAELLGGTLTIEAQPGAGSCVTAELPLIQPLERRRTRR